MSVTKAPVTVIKKTISDLKVGDKVFLMCDYRPELNQKSTVRLICNDSICLHALYDPSNNAELPVWEFNIVTGKSSSYGPYKFYIEPYEAKHAMIEQNISKNKQMKVALKLMADVDPKSLTLDECLTINKILERSGLHTK